jgi:hypothetical protein
VKPFIFVDRTNVSVKPLVFFFIEKSQHVPLRRSLLLVVLHVVTCHNALIVRSYQRDSGIIFTQIKLKSLIAVAVRSKTWVCCRLVAGIADSSPAENIDVRLLFCCVLCR